MADTTTTSNWVTPIPASMRNAHAGNENSGLNIIDRQNLAIVQVFAKNDKIAAVEKKLKISSSAGKASVNKEFTALPLAPGQWILVSESGKDGSFGESISKKLEGIGYVSEQSGSRVCFRIGGTSINQFMERACRLDFHPSVAKAGTCAQTQMAQIGVLIHQVDDAPHFDLYVYSGFAVDFADWMLHTGMKYGVNFTAIE